MRSLILFTALLLSTSLYAQNADDIVGVWLVEEKDAHIKIYEKNNSYYGKVTWIKDPYDENGNPQTDPDGERVMGMELIKNFRFEDGEWVDGTVYDPKKGETYYGSIEMEDEDTLNLRGSMDSFGLLGRTETWTRLEEK